MKNRKRDIAAELIEAVAEITRGGGTRKRIRFDVPDVKAIRKRAGKSQPEFADLLEVPVSTLRDWEQGRRTPTGPARKLLRIADKNPDALTGV